MKDNIVNLYTDYENKLNKMVNEHNKEVYYQMTSEEKKNLDTVKAVIDTFIEDVDFVIKCTNYYYKNAKPKSEDNLTIIIMLGKLHLITNDIRLKKVYDLSCNIIGDVLNKIDDFEENNYDYDELSYDRFKYITNEFKDPYLHREFANVLLEEIFFNDQSSFEEIVHCELTDKDELKTKEDKRNFILYYLEAIGEISLLEYLQTNNNSFMDFLCDKLDDVLKNWGIYMFTLNNNRIHCIKWQSDKYGNDKVLPNNYLSIIKELIIKKKNQGLIDGFKRIYGEIEDCDISYVGETEYRKYIDDYIDELLEEDVEMLTYEQEREDLVVKKEEKEEIKEKCKIFNIDDYRKNKK